MDPQEEKRSGFNAGSHRPMNHAGRRVLVMRHGIVLNRFVLLRAERFFRKKGYEVHNRTYPSTRKRIEEHGKDLADEMLRIDEDFRRRGEPYELYAYVHSMGGLILRHALTHFQLPPVRRAVLVGTPNQGSATARYFRNFPPYRWIFGTSGQQLAADLPGIFGEVGVPVGTELGIIAGDVRWKLYPAPLPRPHDAIVSVAECALPPFPMKILPLPHTPLILASSALEEAEHFFEHGRFRT